MPDKHVKVVEVGPRDGLQNETQPLSTEFKLQLISELEACGFPEVEVTSMVHPKWVPQLADAADLLKMLPMAKQNCARTVLVPNIKGLERALEAETKRVAVFIAASEGFSQKNTNRSIEESLIQTEAVVQRAREAGVTVRGYLSTAFVCPFDGDTPPERAAELTRNLLAMGCDEVSVSDTIGAAVPEDIDRVLEQLEGVDPSLLALHFHDTYGTALANVARGLQRGIRCFDSSVGGAGGCPYAPGATGNLATEDLLYFLERGGWHTGIDRAKVIEAAKLLEAQLNRPLSSHLMSLERGA